MAEVIVVGLGLAGVAALRKLHDAGVKTIGLEAANRLGGRVHSVPFGNGQVDIGGQWCEGENIIYDIVKDFVPPILKEPEQRGQVFLLSDGTELPNEIGTDILEELMSIVKTSDKESKLSVPAYLSNAVKTFPKLSKDPELAESFIEIYKGLIHNGRQEDRRSKSLRGLAEIWPLKGGMMPWGGNGFQNLIDVLLKSYPNPENKIQVDIQLNKEVESIEWRHQSDDGTPRVQVRCKDESVYKAKYAIVTVSVGVLKDRHEELFNPQLPSGKVNAIKNYQMSVIGKIYIEFSKPWWPDSIAYFSILWRQADKAKFPEDWWVTEVFRLSVTDSQPNVLCAWIMGEGALAMERQSEDGVRRGIEKILDMFFKKYNVSDIVAIKRTQWGSDPLTRGAYAYRCVDTELLGGSAGVLGAPLYDDRSNPVVCFAGEATSLHHHGAMHGAVESGFDEAQRIIDHINGKQN